MPGILEKAREIDRFIFREGDEMLALEGTPERQYRVDVKNKVAGIEALISQNAKAEALERYVALKTVSGHRQLQKGKHNFDEWDSAVITLDSRSRRLAHIFTHTHLTGPKLWGIGRYDLQRSAYFVRPIEVGDGTLEQSICEAQLFGDSQVDYAQLATDPCLHTYIVRGAADRVSVLLGLCHPQVIDGVAQPGRVNDFAYLDNMTEVGDIGLQYSESDMNNLF